MNLLYSVPLDLYFMDTAEDNDTVNIFIYLSVHSIGYSNNTNVFIKYICFVRAQLKKMQVVCFIISLIWYHKTIPKVPVESVTQRCAIHPVNKCPPQKAFITLFMECAAYRV